MCRNIRTLHDFEPPAEDEVHAAALQYVRKISGSPSPDAPSRLSRRRPASSSAS